MEGRRHSGDHRNVVRIREARHRSESHGNKPVCHELLEIREQPLGKTGVDVARVSAVDQNDDHGRLRPVVILSVDADLLRMILRGQKRRRGKQQGQSHSAILLAA